MKCYYFVQRRSADSMFWIHQVPNKRVFDVKLFRTHYYCKFARLPEWEECLLAGKRKQIS